MRRIADAQTFTVGDLSGEIAGASSRVVLIQRLIREGLLTIHPPAASTSA